MIDEIIHWNIDPEVFWINETLPVKYYSVLFALGLFIGFQITKQIYKRENLSLKKLDTLFIYVFLGTVLGARLGHCFFYEPSYYLNHPIEILFPIKEVNGVYKFIGYRGLASHGGAIGVLTSILIYCRKYHIEVLKLLDRISIAIPLAGAFIRIGNFMNSEVYGMPTNGNWGVIFVKDDMIPRHPTQLYEALSYMLVFCILIILYKKNGIRRKGLLFGIFLSLLFTARFIIEFFKENQVAFENRMVLNMGQLLSIPFIIIGIYIVFKSFNYKYLKSN